MRPVRFLALAAALAFPLQAQEERPSAREALEKHGPALRETEGVLDVSAGGSAAEPRIAVRVASEEAKAAVRAKWGTAVGGVKLYVYVSTDVGQTEVEKKADPPPKPPAPETKPEPPGNDTLEDCDILRDHLKLKAVTRFRDKKTIDPCQLMRRSRVGGGGGHTFWYTRHRFDCPIRTGKVAKPAKADEFTDWVFTRGFLPARGGSFLVFELKASDKLWFDGVKEDLTSLLPYIREGARWTSAKEEDAGKNWRWEVPK